MRLQFSKMHGLGNDFMVIDATSQSFRPDARQVRQWSDRHTGIGFDQLLVVEPTRRDDADFLYRIYNADGSEVEHCGNGARCFARFVRDRGLTDKTQIPVETARGIIVLETMPDGQVQVDMGVPDFEPASLPYLADTRQTHYELQLDDQTLTIGAVSMGNPHAVTLVENLDTAPVRTIGPLIESHADFPNRVNAGFMQILDEHTIRLRVYERGTGETLACGTGACAAVAIGRDWGRLATPVTVELTGGTLIIDWQGPNTSMLMTGPASHVFDGEIEL